MQKTKYIVIFDGCCLFCNAAVHFIINRDPQAHFVFTPMQSALAKALMQQYCVNNKSIDSLVLIKNDQCYLYSDAVIEISKSLTGYWFVLSIIKIIPQCIRDYGYQLFAKNRYRLFGKKTSCVMPSKAIKSRFIGIDY